MGIVTRNNFIRLIFIEIWRNIKIIRYYPFALAVNIIQSVIVAGIVIYALIFIGFGPSSVGTLLWPFVMLCIGGPSSSLSNDTAIGTFEQVHNSGHSMINIIITRTLADMLIALPSMIVILILIFLMHPAQFNITILFTAIFLSAFSAFGIGIILAGLTLRFRQIGEFTNLVMLISMFSTILPVYILNDVASFLVTSFLPLLGPIYILQESVNINNSLTTLNIISAILNVGVTLFAGIFLFNFSYKRARVNGILGKY